MTCHVVRVDPSKALSVVARLYAADEQDLAGTLPQWTAAWLVEDTAREVIGAIALRSSPAHGEEIMGGAFPGVGQKEAALMLIQAARMSHPQLYAYAEPHLLPLEALEAAGLRRSGAYTRMSGLLPLQQPDVPAGLMLVALSEVLDPQDRLTAQRMYSDRIGHTHVPDEAAHFNFGGSDDALGRLAYDALGNPAGLCRAWLSGENVVLGTPGVRPDLRGGGLRQALLLSVCQAARTAGTSTLQLDAWGDTRLEREEDEALGLSVEVETPILSV